MHRLFLQKHYFYMKLTESSQEDNRFFASIGYCISTGNGAATVTLEHDSSSHQNDTPNAPTCYRKQVGVTFLSGPCRKAEFGSVLWYMASSCLPECPSFLSPKRKRKSATVPMRWTPAGAAAPDPKMRPPDDGLFTGLGAGEQGKSFKTISR